jgi:hypothetical protein
MNSDRKNSTRQLVKDKRRQQISSWRYRPDHGRQRQGVSLHRERAVNPQLLPIVVYAKQFYFYRDTPRSRSVARRLD